MKTEKQVCTAEQAQRLRELGICQDISLFYWYIGDTGTNTDHLILRTPRPTDNLCLSAFTVAELGIMLPRGYCSGNGVLSDEIKWCDKVSYNGDDVIFMNDIVVSGGPTEAIARAAMLISLLESGELIPDECNQRLA